MPRDPFATFDALLALHMLAFVPAEDALQCAGVSRLWHRSTNDDSVWGHWCRRDFNLDAKKGVDHQGRIQDVEHYRAAWRGWRRWGYALGLARVDAPIYLRVIRMWESIEAWTRVHKASILESLAPGARRQDFQDFELTQQKDLPDVVRMIWGVHNGQCLQFDDFLMQGQQAVMRLYSHQAFDGLFGGYTFYSNFVCTRLYSLKYMAASSSDHLVIAANWNGSKPFYLDVADGMVSVTENRVPCVPAGDLGVLRWMEEYARRLTAGVYVAEPLTPGEPHTLGVCLFPQIGPDVSVAVTQGVEARASAVFAPEDYRSCFAYSIRLRVVSAEAFPYPRAQLTTRHWRIEDGAGHTEEVHGDGVIGKFPVLRPGGFRDDEQGAEGAEVPGTFVYQSCTGRLRGVPPGRGRFSGTLDFVPGTIADPLGDQPFAVAVAPFPLAVPEFIY